MSLHTSESYWQQAIDSREKVWMASQALMVTVVTAWLFYHSMLALLFLCPIFRWYYHELKKEKVGKKQEDFLLQFKDMIQSMSSSLRAGYSVENAIRQTQRELLLIYPEKALICEELRLMAQESYIQIPIEQILEEFAKRVRLEEVRNFAGVFTAAKRSGGDMIAIIRSTTEQISDKIEVKREIRTVLAAKQYEFRVMSFIPYLMIFYMSLSFPEFMDCLYGNLMGIGVMSICLCVYAGAYVLGVKLIKIEV